MPSLFKVKLTLIAFCLAVVAASHIYFKGVDDGIAAIDRQSLAGYLDFAKQMQTETRAAKSKPAVVTPSRSVFAVLGEK